VPYGIVERQRAAFVGVVQGASELPFDLCLDVLPMMSPASERGNRVLLRNGCPELFGAFAFAACSGNAGEEPDPASANGPDDSIEVPATNPSP